MNDDTGLHHVTTSWPTPLRRLSSEAPIVGTRMPRTLFGFVWRVSAWDQVWLAGLAIAVSLLSMAPIEFQRRIVNEAVKNKNWDAIYSLALIYAGLVVVHGLLKLLFNSYKSWIGANASRLLRLSISRLVPSQGKDFARTQGVEISLIVSESDAVGSFTSDCITEPVLEGGTLAAAFGYMLILQPTMALLSLVIFVPQAIFVPIMQRAINRKVSGRIETLRKAAGDVLTEGCSTQQKEEMHGRRFGKVFRLDIGIFLLKFILNFLMNLSQHLGTVLVVALGAWFVVHGQTQVGTVVAFLSSLGHVTDPWGAMVGWFQTLMLTGAKYDLVRDAVAKLHETDDAAPTVGGGEPPPTQAAATPQTA